VARSITDPDRQAQALATVARALAQTGQHEQAATVARSITNLDVQAQALATVAEGLAETVDRPGNPRGCETWEDAGSWWHSGSIRRSCVNAR